MVSCPFNGRKGSKCSVTAWRRTRVTLLVLDRRPSLGWRSWRCYLSLIMTLDDTGGLAGPISCPSIPGVVHTSDGRRNMRRFVYFRTDAHTLVWVWLDILYVYIYVLPSSSLFFFFFYAWDFVLHWWLTGSVAHVVATCLTPIGWEASFSVEIFSISRIFQGKGLLILTFPFCSFSLLLLSYFPSTCGLSNFLRCAFRPLSSQFPPNFKVCSLFKLYFLSDFLSFEFLFSLFLCIFLW